MPLSFHSRSHGNIAFGFFNIESDMLLLENYFFFADDFCEWLCQMAAQKDNSASRFEFPAYRIDDPAQVGDLMGAIHGVHFTGFIGETYKLYPFPSDPQLFKQNPDGFKTQQTIKSLIDDVAVNIKIMFEFDKNGPVSIGPYIFDTPVFHELIHYVWQGGYPLWKDLIRPDYVLKMKKVLEKSNHPFFEGVFSTV